jgi:Uma2 family endonuclease
MSGATLISVEEYLRTSNSPDREYRDGVLVERNVGKKSHSDLQGALAQFIRSRRKQWKVKVCVELWMKAREGWYSMPDVCVYLLPDRRARSRTGRHSCGSRSCRRATA